MARRYGACVHTLMRVLSITNCPLDPRLGSGTTVIRFAEGLRRLDHDVEIMAPRDYESAPRIRVAKQLRQGLGAYRAIAGRLAAQRYDLIEFYGAEFWPAIVSLARRRRRPLLVAHTNGLELLNYEREARYHPARGLKVAASRSVHRRLFGLSFRHTDAFVSLCEADRRWVVNHRLYGSSMTAVVPPAPDEAFRALDEHALEGKEDRVAFIGSWTERKGIGLIAAVMGAVLLAHPQVVFDVFGASASATAVAGSFDPAVRGRIQVHGSLEPSALAAAVARAKVFFFPSQYEGYGLALLEAMMCGLAVVTTPTGLGAELAGTEGLVCDFEDGEGMRRAIERLLQDESLRSRIAANGRRRAAALRWEDSAVQLSNVYGAWLDAHVVR
jgi:glycosyltransferase involved in cell wall biosynthesis